VSSTIGTCAFCQKSELGTRRRTQRPRFAGPRGRRPGASLTASVGNWPPQICPTKKRVAASAADSHGTIVLAKEDAETIKDSSVSLVREGQLKSRFAI
jgi:hypothetical protein